MRRRRFRQTSIFSFNNLIIYMLLESTLNYTVRAKIYSVLRMQISPIESEATYASKCKKKKACRAYIFDIFKNAIATWCKERPRD